MRFEYFRDGVLMFVSVEEHQHGLQVGISWNLIRFLICSLVNLLLHAHLRHFLFQGDVSPSKDQLLGKLFVSTLHRVKFSVLPVETRHCYEINLGQTQLRWAEELFKFYTIYQRPVNSEHVNIWMHFVGDNYVPCVVENGVYFRSLWNLSFILHHLTKRICTL